MVSALISVSSGAGSSPGRGHNVVFSYKTLCLYSASFHPGAQMSTGQLNAGVTLRWTIMPSRGVKIFQVAALVRNRDKVRPNL